MRAAYEYQGDATCAADGMCQEKCPVKINTGELIKSIRAEEIKASGTSRADALSMARPAAPPSASCANVQTSGPQELCTSNLSLLRCPTPPPLPLPAPWLCFCSVL